MSTTQFIQSLLKWLASPGQYASQLGTAIRSAGDLWSSTETQSKLDEKISGVRAGENVTIDVSDPYNPKINAIGTGFGDMSKSVYDPTGVEADAFDRANHHGDIDAGDINGLATVATSGDYDDLTNKPSLAAVATSGDYDDLTGKPTLGTAAAADTGDFATAAQGGLADSAVQPAEIADMLVDGDIGVSVQAYDADTAKTDVAQQYTAAQRSNITALTIGANTAGELDWTLASGNDFSVTANANFVWNLPSDIASYVGQSGFLIVTQDGTGGWTMSVESGFEPYNSDTLFDIASGAGEVTIVSYKVISASVIVLAAGGAGVAL